MTTTPDPAAIAAAEAEVEKLTAELEELQQQVNAVGLRRAHAMWRYTELFGRGGQSKAAQRFDLKQPTINDMIRRAKANPLPGESEERPR